MAMMGIAVRWRGSAVGAVAALVGLLLSALGGMAGCVTKEVYTAQVTRTTNFQRLLAEGESAQRLLAMVTRQYRHLLLTKELLERRVRGPEISARLGVQGFVVQRLLKQAPAYTIDRLRQAYRRLLEADLSVKRGIYDDETALQLLLFELAALVRPGTTPPGGRPGYSRPRGGPGRAPSGAGTAPSGSG
jgi:hypothetical protein